jgi:hypothetical protein
MKNELQIGDIAEILGIKVQVMVDDNDDSCDWCAFYHNRCAEAPFCSAYFRSNRDDIYFKKIEQ